MLFSLASPFKNVATWSGKDLQRGNLSVTDKHVGAIVGFAPTIRGEKITAKVASSFISTEQAELNLKELGNDDFNDRRSKRESDIGIRLWVVCRFRAALLIKSVLFILVYIECFSSPADYTK